MADETKKDAEGADASGEKKTEKATKKPKVEEAALNLAAEEAKRVDPQALKAQRKEKKDAAAAKADSGPQAAPAPKAKGGGGGGGGKKDKKKGGAEAAEPFVKRTGPARLRTFYQQEVVPQLMKQFSYTSTMAVPKLLKISVNMGLGEALQNPKILEAAEEEMRVITGQKPVVTTARKSIATFKLRQGQRIGCMVTLRRDRMFEFFDRLVTFALPRMRDFKGVSPRSFDGRGNYSLGLREQIIFPEINYDKIEKIKGLNITIVTSARTDEEGTALLRYMGMPFRK